jgi:hypothetical protein
MPKNRKYSKPKMESKQQSDQMLMSPLMSGVKISDHEVYGVSAMQQVVATSNSDFDITVKDLIIDTPLLLSSTSLNTLLEGPIAELINAYATSRGYSTGVTYAKVSGYVFESFQLLTLLFHMFRAQNVRNLVTPGGKEIGKILSLRPSVQFTNSMVADHVLTNTTISTITSHVDDGAVSISNSDWANEWLSQLVHMKLPAPLVKTAASLFGVYYQTTGENGSCLYSFVPQPITTSAGVSVETRFNSIAASMAAKRLADPDLVDILNFLGFTNEEVIDLDFNRDLRKQTVKIVQDPAFLSAFINTNFYNFKHSDADVDNLYYDIYGNFTAMNAPDDVQLKADVVFGARMYKGDLFEHFVIKQISDAGTILYNAIFPVPVGIDLTTVPSVNQFQIDRAIALNARVAAAGLPILPYSDSDAKVFADSSGNIVNASITNFVNEHANVYLLPGTFDFYTTAKKAEMIMNNTVYREEIQRLSNSIRTSSITKAT